MGIKYESGQPHTNSIHDADEHGRESVQLRRPDWDLMNARGMIRNMTSSIAHVAERFNAMQGRLRVSVTHACQLHCRFCHQEGIDRHWEAVHIDPDFLAKIVAAYSNLGGRYIELTGGEPTIHPNIGQLVDVVAGENRSIILCTNGLRLDRVQDQIEKKNSISSDLAFTRLTRASLPRLSLGPPGILTCSGRMSRISSHRAFKFN